MRRRLKWVRYVGDVQGSPPTEQAHLAAFPDNFKTFDHACSTCGSAYAPFGVGYPRQPEWFCPQHIGVDMPEVAEALDHARFDKIRHDALLLVNLWAAVAVAGERRDKVSAWQACENAAKLTKTTFALVRELGTETAP